LWVALRPRTLDQGQQGELDAEFGHQAGVRCGQLLVAQGLTRGTPGHALLDNGPHRPCALGESGIGRGW
jgi:hypothetical protein